MGNSLPSVSNDDEESHKKFCDKFNLNFILLCDTDASVSKTYGVYEKQYYVFRGITRSTFIIDEGGILKKVFYKVNAEQSMSDVIGALESNK